MPYGAMARTTSEEKTIAGRQSRGYSLLLWVAVIVGSRFPAEPSATVQGTRIDRHDGACEMLTAGDIMTDSLVTIRPEASIEEAIELLLKHGISGLPVTDPEGHLVGVITEFALLAVVYDQRVKDHTVGEHMTRNVITVDAEDPMRRAADLCIVNRVRRLPVMRNGRLVGLIARRDVLHALHESSISAGSC
jgi:CBS domain-containing protein